MERDTSVGGIDIEDIRVKDTVIVDLTGKSTIAKDVVKSRIGKDKDGKITGGEMEDVTRINGIIRDWIIL